MRTLAQIEDADEYWLWNSGEPLPSVSFLPRGGDDGGAAALTAVAASAAAAGAMLLLSFPPQTADDNLIAAVTEFHARGGTKVSGRGVLQDVLAYRLRYPPPRHRPRSRSSARATTRSARTRS